jgi:flavin reductase (DIM6/NTAB) family NADH-FMN oxidoreductase RutF
MATALTKEGNAALHEILREFPYAIYAVGIRGGHGEVNFLIVSWLSQCSFDPPLVMMAVRRDSHSYDLISQGSTFSINLIEKNKRDVAQQLVKPADRVGDKVEQFDYFDGDIGAPVLRSAFAYIECKVLEIHEPGDHAVVIGEIATGTRRVSGAQLMCSDLHWHYAG